MGRAVRWRASARHKHLAAAYRPQHLVQSLRTVDTVMAFARHDESVARPADVADHHR